MQILFDCRESLDRLTRPTCLRDEERLLPLYFSRLPLRLLGDVIDPTARKNTTPTYPATSVPEPICHEMRGKWEPDRQ